MNFFNFFFVGSFEDSFRNSSYPRITREIIISSLFKIKVIPQSFKMKASINEPENPQRNAKRKTYKQITMRHVSEKKIKMLSKKQSFRWFLQIFFQKLLWYSFCKSVKVTSNFSIKKSYEDSFRNSSDGILRIFLLGSLLEYWCSNVYF